MSYGFFIFPTPQILQIEQCIKVHAPYMPRLSISLPSDSPYLAVGAVVTNALLTTRVRHKGTL